MNQDLISSHGRIRYLSERNKAATYLEIGVCTGETFFRVDLPCTVAVDPSFRFDPLEHKRNGSHFLQVSSDEFFEKLDARDPAVQNSFSTPFDVIFIDGLHTFEQSYRDFTNSLRYAHDDALWLIDDTVPCDVYSTIPDQATAIQKRTEAGVNCGAWHGDVYKTVFAIHDCHPEFSYCTLMEGNPQTILWKTETSARRPLFSSIAAINSLSFYDMLRYANVIMPIHAQELPAHIGRSLDPAVDAASDSWLRIVTSANFCDLPSNMTLQERLQVVIYTSLAARMYRKLKQEGLHATVTAVNKKLRQR